MLVKKIGDVVMANELRFTCEAEFEWFNWFPFKNLHHFKRKSEPM